MDEHRPKMPRPAAVAELLASVLHGKPAEKRLREGRIWIFWEEVVGEQIASRAHPVSFRDGTLTVAVSSAPWMQQLNFLKGGIRERLNRELGEELIRDIYLKAGKTERLVQPRQPAQTARRPLAPAELEEVETRTSCIEDPELREAIARLLSRHLADRSDLS